TSGPHARPPVPDLVDREPRAPHVGREVHRTRPVENGADVAVEEGMQARPEAADGRWTDIDQIGRDVVASVVVLLEEVDLAVTPVDDRVDVGVKERMQVRPKAADRRWTDVDQIGRDVVADVVVLLEEVDLAVAPVDRCVDFAVEERVQMGPEAADRGGTDINEVARNVVADVMVLLEEVDLAVAPVDRCVDVAMQERVQVSPE